MQGRSRDVEAVHSPNPPHTALLVERKKGLWRVRSFNGVVEVMY